MNLNSLIITTISGQPCPSVSYSGRQGVTGPTRNVVTDLCVKIFLHIAVYCVGQHGGTGASHPRSKVPKNCPTISDLFSTKVPLFVISSILPLFSYTVALTGAGMSAESR
eukprot:GHVU01230960.1.p1 GENE.GHVU01230960.1~~GHVU01230960.1.p1  ORF type:complete len:110 (+),score=0.11 GHVU01230960.1:180-509(+)